MCEPGEFITHIDLKFDIDEISHSGITGIRFKCSKVYYNNEVLKKWNDEENQRPELQEFKD